MLKLIYISYANMLGKQGRIWGKHVMAIARAIAYAILAFPLAALLDQIPESTLLSFLYPAMPTRIGDVMYCAHFDF